MHDAEIQVAEAGLDDTSRPKLYSVSQLARQLGITARTIRFYEDKHLLSPQRAGSTRVYNGHDRERLVHILRGKQIGFSLREIKELLDLYDADLNEHQQVRLLQKNIRSRLLKFQGQQLAIEESVKELTEIDQQCDLVLASRQDG